MLEKNQIELIQIKVQALEQMYNESISINMQYRISLITLQKKHNAISIEYEKIKKELDDLKKMNVEENVT